MYRAVYIHTHIYNDRNYMTGAWRVFDGLLLRRADPLSLPAEIIFVDDSGAIRIEKEAHITNQCGAATWVYAHEFELMADMVERDWQRRGCWQEAYDDIQRIRAERGNPSGKPPDCPACGGTGRGLPMFCKECGGTGSARPRNRTKLVDTIPSTNSALWKCESCGEEWASPNKLPCTNCSGTSTEASTAPASVR